MKLINIKNKNILIAVIVGLLLFGFGFVSWAGIIGGVINNKKVNIALCPTYYNLNDYLEENNFKVIKTSSSAESFAMLASSETDYVLSGRTPRLDEGAFLGEFLSSRGYSFLANYPETINSNELLNRKIYTDLDWEIIKEEFTLNDVTFVDDVYNYISEGIIITSWENTNYSRAEIVQVINTDGERHPLSRRPILYCQNKCDFNIINKLKKIYE